MSIKPIPKRARLRTDRKHPQIKIEFYNSDPVYKALSCDAETARAVVDEINRKIALSVFNVEEFIPAKRSSITLEKFQELYLKYRKLEQQKGNVSQNTVDQDGFTLRLFINVLGPDKRLSEIDRDTVQYFISELLNKKLTQYGKPYKPNAINSYLKHLSSAFSYAKLNNFIDTNPFFEVSKLKTKNHKRILSAEEVQRIREYLKDKPQWQMDSINFALWTGCRLESITKLKSEDIKEGFVILREKGDKIRKVPLLPEARKMIIGRIEEINRSENWRAKEGYIFWEIVHRESPSKAFSDAIRKLGIPRATFHDLRKTFATRLLDQGVSLESVQKILGHEDFKTTQMAYAETTMEKISSEMEKVKAV